MFIQEQNFEIKFVTITSILKRIACKVRQICSEYALKVGYVNGDIINSLYIFLKCICTLSFVYKKTGAEMGNFRCLRFPQVKLIKNGLYIHIITPANLMAYK